MATHLLLLQLALRVSSRKWQPHLHLLWVRPGPTVPRTVCSDSSRCVVDQVRLLRTLALVGVLHVLCWLRHPGGYQRPTAIHWHYEMLLLPVELYLRAANGQ